MADNRQAPSIYEIQDMTIPELMREMGRLSVVTDRLRWKLDNGVGPFFQTERALIKNNRALTQCTAELAAQYSESEDARRTTLFRLFGGIVREGIALRDTDQDSEEWQRHYEMFLLSLNTLDTL